MLCAVLLKMSVLYHRDIAQTCREMYMEVINRVYVL